jgi:propanol-preferring alcohol dehydrogenase
VGSRLTIESGFQVLIGSAHPTILEKGAGQVKAFKKGDRIGVPWLGYTGAHCRYCLSDENTAISP